MDMYKHDVHTHTHIHTHTYIQGVGGVSETTHFADT
jgi:hypothetical protein